MHLIAPSSVESSGILRSNLIEISSSITDSGSKKATNGRHTSYAKSNVVSEVVHFVEKISNEVYEPAMINGH